MQYFSSTASQSLTVVKPHFNLNHAKVDAKPVSRIPQRTHILNSLPFVQSYTAILILHKMKN